MSAKPTAPTADDSYKLGICGGTRLDACHIDQFACDGAQGSHSRDVSSDLTECGTGEWDVVHDLPFLPLPIGGV